MTAYLTTARRRLADDHDELSRFCTELLASLPRSDQRRWGEVYIRGLLSVPGRKSIRRISDHVVGRRADQSLQQFVNQSPWEWSGVRSALAHRVSSIRPRAWIVQDADFPKHGHSSVGVARQYAPSVGRTLNCQRGVAVSLAGAAERCVVNWRLVLPRSWDEDPERRVRARIPDDVRHHPHWRYVFDAVDEMTTGWGLHTAPLVWNAVEQDAQPVLRGLAARRGLSYLVRVPEHTAVLRCRSASGDWRMSTARELAETSARRRHVMLRDRGRRPGTGAETWYSLLSLCDLCPPDQRVHVTSSCVHGGTRRVLARWSWGSGSGRLTGVWLTNLAKMRLSQLVDLVALCPPARQEELTALREDFGLHDFEGRSYAGWHHHVTLVSAAHAYHMLRRTPEPTN